MTTYLGLSPHEWHDGMPPVSPDVGPPVIWFVRGGKLVDEDDGPEDGKRGRYFSPEVMADELRSRGVERSES